MAGLGPRPVAKGRRFGRRFLRAEDGATAVEFAFVVLPFFFMVFSILEMALIFTVNAVLENATLETGRLIRTGQASAAGMDGPAFKNRLCAGMSIFKDQCADRATVDVRVVPQFADAPQDDMAEDEDFTPVYANGLPGDLIVVRVWYEHPLITAFLVQGVAHTQERTTVLMATTAFRNEPP